MKGVKQTIKDILHREKSDFDKSEYQRLIDDLPENESTIEDHSLTDDLPKYGAFNAKEHEFEELKAYLNGYKPLRGNDLVTQGLAKFVRPIPLPLDTLSITGEDGSFTTDIDYWAYVPRLGHMPLLWRDRVTDWSSWSTISEARKTRYRIPERRYPGGPLGHIFELYYNEKGDHEYRPTPKPFKDRWGDEIKLLRAEGFIIEPDKGPNKLLTSSEYNIYPSRLDDKPKKSNR
ncbi:hypothetical protein GLAREA_12381 [Glarea lozoyensis ATCC 20868]|uniref:Uncharacterized protein n=1 Tax=Glarea lozoyensis (strain ATCC 20868 / MF5171) TaxID=1116229 RepID=S3D192_GLAL2|nr:uncharacterized protein GLAREA_12381 [Glarea lozoyensis ATCC 20868]EPE31625.1 hypothetical protein GLAREA_12381 [Glarea lozoyensis ATCC 20868]